MATVFLAHDMRHDRKVALKALKPELAAVLGAQRFLNEIQVTANLQHPHILPLYDSGEADGLLFYVMPVVEGGSLRERMRRERVLGVADAVTIAAQVAAALEFAHRKGVIHRDLKPENVLLHEGEAMLADFGIALAVREAGGDRLTETGLSLGTPSYMSPEQATGEREIDARSDLYSLAAITYEMLAGEAPFTGATPRAVIAKLLTGTPTPLRALRDPVAPALDAVVMRGLAKEPADRFAGAHEFRAALVAAMGQALAETAVPAAGTGSRMTSGVATAPAPDAQPVSVSATPSPPTDRAAARRGVWWVAAAGVLFAALAYGIWAPRRSPPVATDAGSSSVAVLPFVERNAPGGEFLGDGIAETMIYALGKVPGLKVAAQTSAFSFKGKEVDLADIGAKLGVATVLTGSVQRAGSRLRVTVRLENVASQAEIWTEQYDREMTDVFALQDDIARAVVARLQATSGAGGPPSVAGAGTSNLAAYEAYLQGRYVFAQRGGTIGRALQFFERAVALDSAYALAWVGIADSYAILNVYGGVRTSDAAPRVEAALRRALALDSLLAPAHAARAFWLHSYHNDLPGADRAFRRAIALDSTYVPARYWYAMFLAGARYESDESARHARKAVELDPLSSHAANQLANTLLIVGDTSGAIAEARRAIALNANWQNYRVLARTLLHARRWGEAAAAADTAVALSDRGHWAVGDAATARALAGDTAGARAFYAELLTLARAGKASPLIVSGAALWVEGWQASIPWGERAFRERDPVGAWPAASTRFLRQGFAARGEPVPPALLAMWRRRGVPESELTGPLK